MWQKVTVGVYWAEDDADLLLALASTADEGIPLKIPEQWRAAGRALLDRIDGGAGRTWLSWFGGRGNPGES